MVTNVLNVPMNAGRLTQDNQCQSRYRFTKANRTMARARCGLYGPRSVGGVKEADDTNEGCNPFNQGTVNHGHVNAPRGKGGNSIASQGRGFRSSEWDC